MLSATARHPAVGGALREFTVMSKSKGEGRLFGHLRRHLLAGLLTVVPIWVTWLVLHFIFEQLSRYGAPWVRALAGTLHGNWPTLADWLLEPLLQSVVAAVLILVLLTLLGWLATRIIGTRVLAAFDTLMGRIPLVQSLYGGVRKLVSAVQQKPDKVQRVVLIPFPTPEMKTVGFVTRLLTDADSGRELAAVYVPTTPNPTSGYLEIVPLDQVISTNWTVDEAMTFIISGGAVAPERINYSVSA